MARTSAFWPEGDDPESIFRHAAGMSRTANSHARLKAWLAPIGVFAATSLATAYLITPGAPGKDRLRAEWEKRTTDQHYAGCDEARTNRHEDIASWEPSYRRTMDADGDGLACEPYSGARPS